MSIGGDDDLNVSEDELLYYDDSISLDATYAELRPLEPFAEIECENDCRVPCIDFNGDYHDSNSLEYIQPLIPVRSDNADVQSTVQPSTMLIISLLEGKNNFNSVDGFDKNIYGYGIDYKQSVSQSFHSSDACPSPSVAGNTLAFDWSDFGLDTRDVAEKVTSELKRLNISQVLFAQKILGRSQGTLSDLLRNPKPWAKMKSGRETYSRMLKWLHESDSERLSIILPPKSCRSPMTPAK